MFTLCDHVPFQFLKSKQNDLKSFEMTVVNTVDFIRFLGSIKPIESQDMFRTRVQDWEREQYMTAY
ncbi:hypothetical protein A616_19185 [Brevibacillus brevis X23]|nr:hypothetical protein A616_19185 [Brevibacillus brevis X23]